jgi:hypothetical protein
MPSFPKSRRDQVAEARAGNEFYRLMYAPHKPPQIVYAPEKPKRERHVPDPNAPPLERDVLKAVWKYLAHHPRVAWVTRLNSGTVMADFGADGVHPLRMNYKRGISDLIGQMRDGRFLACEVKREGANLMDHQREFLNEVLRHGGVAFVARSIEDAEKALA